MPSKVPDGHRRGWIVPIGGAENKENDRRILERFVRVSGAEEADIVVIPTASRVHETGARYEQVFSDIGAARVTVMDFDTAATARRRDASSASRKRAASSSPGATSCGSRRCWAARRSRSSSACVTRVASPSAAPARAPASSPST